MWKVAVLAGVVSCVAPSSVTCPDGTTCPTGTTCDDVRNYCLTPAQTTACNGISDGKRCDAAGMPGICDRGLCEPGCGDGHTDQGEHCDDGNFANHDGCSSSCEVEVATWIQQKPAWGGATQLSAAWDDSLGRLLVFGGLDSKGLTDQIWQYDPTKHDTPSGGWKEISAAFTPAQRPAPRIGAAMTYDSTRGVIVMFGGADQSPYYIDELWEYVNMGATFEGEPIGTWRRVQTATTPGGRFAPSMAFDPAINKTVMFGGFAATALARDTWFFDGTNWTSMVTTVKPLIAQRGVMAFDLTRNKLVLYGNVSINAATYEFTGTDWTSQILTPNPSARRGAVMAYDSNRGKLVLFGGQLGSLPDVGQDTWTYDGTWQQISGVEAPPGRRTAAMAVDPVNHLLVLVGGSITDGSPPFDDEWELDAAGWKRHTPRFGPVNMTSPAGAYSPDQHAVYMVGGLTNETWSNNGTRWSQDADTTNDPSNMALVYSTDQHRFIMAGGMCNSLAPECQNQITTLDTSLFDPVSHTWSAAPATWPDAARRQDFAFAYDAVAHRAVASGGSSWVGAPQKLTLRDPDSWVTDGTTWTPIAGSEQPAATSLGASAFDPGRGTVISFDSLGVTRELRDGAWATLETAGDHPVGRQYAGMAYNPIRKRMTLVGGTDMNGNDLVEVWELDTSLLTWTKVFVSGATPLPRHKFALVMQPNVRSVMLFGGAGGTQFGLGDTWSLKYVSSTPDEDCTDGMDNDGDGQIDAADVDCNIEP